MRTLVLLLAALDPSEYRQAVPGYRFAFPRDHFEHRDFRTEWWYYTGNVRSAEGRRFGFELVFFRQGQRRGPSNNQSAWRIDDLYLAHMALTDVDRGQFHYFKRLNRAGPGIAGASFEQRQIWTKLVRTTGKTMSRFSKPARNRSASGFGSRWPNRP